MKSFQRLEIILLIRSSKIMLRSLSSISSAMMLLPLNTTLKRVLLSSKKSMTENLAWDSKSALPDLLTLQESSSKLLQSTTGSPYKVELYNSNIDFSSFRMRKISHIFWIAPSSAPSCHLLVLKDQESWQAYTKTKEPADPSISISSTKCYFSACISN
jgi:hypothetical protein